MKVVVCQEWDEVKTGMSRPCGCSLHLTSTKHRFFIDDYHKQKAAFGGCFPESMILPVNDLFLIIVDDLRFEYLKRESNGVWLSQSEYIKLVDKQEGFLAEQAGIEL